ncbi:MAG TPA: protein-methionine-sulfoxide reductase catalytic subunit MsrP, partial [Steroidobacteraceae bacterium]|nr:protein-methionine-sulfoxide reductase catalytic subunit MsrP [Steroidobacteraceae bacterium]
MLTRVPRIAASEITAPEVYFNRRTLLAGALASAASAWLPAAEGPQPAEAALTYARNPQYSVSEPPNKLEEIAGYNNFYEFGTDKESPSKYAHTLRTRPWSVTVQGEAEVRGRFDLEDLLKGQALEERIYRFRCVEAWSLVVPWIGFPLSNLLARFKPTSNAKYVEFTTLYDPGQMPGQHSAVLNWPYVEGLRIDEAMHPLTLMVVGLYGRILPNQDGAPLRLIVPWKYGFKSIKSIVQIGFSARQPDTAWNVAAPHEYGFYAN